MFIKYSNQQKFHLNMFNTNDMVGKTYILNQLKLQLVQINGRMQLISIEGTQKRFDQ